MKPFQKPAIDIPAQLALLKQRGLSIQDEAKAHCFLEAVSFFRLTPYMRPFQIPEDADHAFKAGTRLRDLTRLYDFDRRLRLLVIDAIERIEVAARAAISNHMGPTHGAHWYLQRQLFQGSYRHQELLDSIRNKQDRARQDHQRECRRIDASRASTERKEQLKNLRAKESYARHYALTYDAPDLMPAWAAMEEITLGDLSHLFKGLARDADRKAIARRLDLPGPLLQSWLHTLTTIRNICAHHARMWNRELGIRPELPKTVTFLWPQHLQEPGQHTRVFTVLCILNLLMRRVSPHTSWDRRLHELLADFPETNLRAMGFPPDWQQDPFWQLSN
ncbi:Abi family protein [Pseudomonas aeruginosa]|uniref:Abi family protein n=1 Tax=Pseudomonas TaxID=286 RepID=UPI0003B9C233|nr:Abi family protein [Pseudomonas aeruginosa]ALZ34723.1 DNA-binding protein [Pseudomonas aeruginosa]EIU2705045.1 Abi family protein [Pseudomonas aeruginosa]EKX5591246.1 Abi family protein [Pseudomonas aeruginosa]EKY0819450.1 Abi family protein [Pseudomonas aeruginosa]ELH1107740.1 Abi family protein [Pseudomonas aeruginosa]